MRDISGRLKMGSSSMTRAALDIGSGSMKIVIAQVERSISHGRGATHHVVVKTLLSREEEVLLAQDLKQQQQKSQGNNLSDEILTRAKVVLSDFKCLADNHGCTEVAGAATAVFRIADNGGAVVNSIREELDINLRIVTQEEEGALGFLTGLAFSPQEPKRTVVWDSGGASFQVTTQVPTKGDHGTASPAYEVYKGPWGSSLATAAAIQQIQGRQLSRSPSPNPMTPIQAQDLVQHIRDHLPLPSSLVGNAITQPDSAIIAIGGETCVFRLVRLILGIEEDSQVNVSVADVQEAMQRVCSKSDEELSVYPQKEMVVPKLCLLSAAMQHLQIQNFQYAYTNGSCMGVLVQPDFWTEAKS